MRWRRIVAVLALLAPAAVVPALAAPASAPSRVIVQFAGGPALNAGPQARQRTATLRADHAAAARRAGVQITHDFTQALNAMAVTTDPAGVARLRALPGVAAVRPDQPMRASAEPDPDVALINAPEVW